MTISIQTREIQYNAADGQRLVGYFAAPSSQTPHAGIIVAPEWWGRNEYILNNVLANWLNTVMPHWRLICTATKMSPQMRNKPMNG